MFVVSEIEPCRLAVLDARRDGRRTGLVLTMGALHEGHVSLLRAARRRCDFVAVTIFVNPTQFGPGEDLDDYPVTLEADLEACRGEGVDLVFTPTVATMYPKGDVTTVHVAGLTEGLCGAHRSGHFDGVTTVVAKLFEILPTDLAFFGEKDYQQLLVIRQMAGDLHLPIQIVGCPIVREPDGLAMSSRNRKLSPQQRIQAVSLSRALHAAAKRVRDKERDVERLVQTMTDQIKKAGHAQIDYIEVVDAVTLAPLVRIDRSARACVAVRIGSCRLIDNIALDVPDAGG